MFVRLVTLGIFGLLSSAALAVESFNVELGAEEETLGDIKPAFLSFQQEPLPAISVFEVIRRYRKLFDETKEPSVRIDALHRLTALEMQFGERKERSLEEEKALYQLALDSYEMIVGSGVYYQRVDELLYQTAKASEYTGKTEKALKSLEQLVGLYPNSHLYIEALFRVGESYFSLGNYVKAEKAYRKLLSVGQGTPYYEKSEFMLAWSLFKQYRYDESGQAFITVMDRLNGRNLDQLEGIDKETMGDSLRALSLAASYREGGVYLDALLEKVGQREYAYRLYEGLALYYLKQKRYEDSAATARSYIAKYPQTPGAAMLALSIISTYNVAGFSDKVLDHKAAFVQKYATDKISRVGWSAGEKLNVSKNLEQYIAELARYYQLKAQDEKVNAVQVGLFVKAAEYYELFDQLFPQDERSGSFMFLAGEARSRAQDLEKAIHNYEISAYKRSPHEKSGEAGYAAIHAYSELIKNADETQKIHLEALRKTSVLMFERRYNDDIRVPMLLAELAEKAYQAAQLNETVSLATRVVHHERADNTQVRSAQILLGHSQFESQEYLSAQAHYKTAMDMLDGASAIRKPLQERLAAAVYKHAEYLQKTGRTGEAVDEYLRVAVEVPESQIVSSAYYDAATLLLETKRWSESVEVFTRFRQMFPDHQLVQTIPDKLIYAYLESGQKTAAAEELIEISTHHEDTEKRRSALYQAATLYMDEQKMDMAVPLFERYIKQYPKPFDVYFEAHVNIANYYEANGDRKNEREWLKKMVTADGKAENERTDRSRQLSARATSMFANDAYDRFVSVRLTVPLKKSLKIKRKYMEDAISKYKKVMDYGVAQFTTEATFKLAKIYQTLSKDLMNSDRPKGLDELELEQYSILLEEQAYPYEEQAIELYQLNAAYARDGIYDKWVQESFGQLSNMVPGSYLRQERTVEYVSDIQ